MTSKQTVESSWLGDRCPQRALHEYRLAKNTKSMLSLSLGNVSGRLVVRQEEDTKNEIQIKSANLFHLEKHFSIVQHNQKTSLSYPIWYRAGTRTKTKCDLHIDS